MAHAGRYDIEVQQGATFSLPLVWKASGALVNLTGYTARMMIRADFDDVSPLVTLTTENGRIALGGALGTIDLTISAAVTAALTDWGKGFYDLELVDGGNVKRLLAGHAVLSKEATR